MPRWSPDGSRIAFHAMVDGRFQVFVIDAAGGFDRQLTQNDFNSVAPKWTPDGQFVLFESDDRGENNIWRMSAEGGRVELLMENASSPWPLANDEWIFLRDRKLWSRKRSGELLDLGPWSLLRWTVWRHKIVGVRRVGRARYFAIANRETGELEKVEEISDELPTPATPVVSADGQWIYYMQTDIEGTDIMLAENFVP